MNLSVGEQLNMHVPYGVLPQSYVPCSQQSPSSSWLSTVLIWHATVFNSWTMQCCGWVVWDVVDMRTARMMLIGVSCTSKQGDLRGRLKVRWYQWDEMFWPVSRVCTDF